MERWLPSLQGPPLQYIIILLCLSVNASWPPETPGPPRFPRRPSAEADEPGPTVNARLGKKARRRNIRFLPSTCQAWVNVISRLYQRNFFYSQQTMAAFGYQKYIFYLYIYMSLNVNPLSPDKWFCNIYEVCVLGWIQTKSRAVMKPRRAVQSLCSSRFPTERHNRNQSVCDMELCSLLLLHFGRRQMKCSVFVSTNNCI